MYAGLINGLAWPGYAAAAGFYFSSEFGFGDIYCEAFGYLWYFVDTFGVFINFAGGDCHEDHDKEGEEAEEDADADNS